MLTIPAIDLRGGSVVRLQQGRFDQETRYDVDPVAIARQWRQDGATWIHIVDLDGARTGRPRQTEVLRRIATEVGGPIQLGGGLRTSDDIASALEAGADRVVIGSAALSDPDLVVAAVARYGERVAAAIDARNERVSIGGWTNDVDVAPLDLAIRLREAGIVRIVYTDIMRDGAMRGPNLDATRRIAAKSGLAVIASGGVSSLADLRQLATPGGANIEGAIVGKALYEGRFTLREALAAAEGGT